MTRPAVLVTVRSPVGAVDYAVVSDAPVGTLAVALADDLRLAAPAGAALGPPQGPAWPATATLDDLGVRDGDVLRLTLGDGLSRATP